MNAPTRASIEAGHPLRWEADGIDGFGTVLIATTYTWENGHARERRLAHTFSRENARRLHAEVVAAGGHIHGPGPDEAWDTWKERQDYA